MKYLKIAIDDLVGWCSVDVEQIRKDLEPEHRRARHVLKDAIKFIKAMEKEGLIDE